MPPLHPRLPVAKHRTGVCLWCAACAPLAPAHPHPSLPPSPFPSPALCSFPSTELYKGSGALVQLQSMEQAAAAIQALNGSFPRGATQPLLVRYADSPGAEQQHALLQR